MKPKSTWAFILICVSWVPAQNQCLELDGIDSALSVAAASGLNGVTAFTIEAWVRSDTANNGNKVVDIGTLSPEYRWEMSNGGQAAGFVGLEGLGYVQVGSSVATSWGDGSWHHWALVDDGATVKFYLDGSLVESAPSLGASWNMNNRPIRIGRRLTPEHYWAGALDELRIWDVARSAVEINIGMAHSIDTAFGLVSAYHFDGDASDATGTNSASLEGNPTFAACTLPAVPFYPGSGEDLVLATGIGSSPTLLPDVRVGLPGESLLVHIDSPNGSYVGTIPFLVADLFVPGAPPIGLALFPEVAVDPPSTLVLFCGASSFFPTLLPTTGLSFLFNVPSLSGLNVLLQAGALAPSAIANNPFFTMTNAHVIQIP